MTSISIEAPITPPLLTRAIIIRSAVVAVVIGSLLTVLNQWDAIYSGADFKILPMALVYQTPFVVVTISQVVGIRLALRDKASGWPISLRDESLVQTMFSHGIPLRSLIVGLLMGSINTLIVTSTNLLQSGQPGPLPTALIAQAFTLPIFFGFLSQALSYRRAFAKAPRYVQRIVMVSNR